MIELPLNQPSKNSRRSNFNDGWLSKELSNSAASLAIATAFFLLTHHTSIGSFVRNVGSLK